MTCPLDRPAAKSPPRLRPMYLKQTALPSTMLPFVPPTVRYVDSYGRSEGLTTNWLLLGYPVVVKYLAGAWG